MFVAFMFTACGALRLARFNVLSSSSTGTPLKPSKYVVGLPIPPAAGILVSLLVANRAVGGALGDESNTVGLAAVTVLLSLLMVSTVNFRSFKDLKFNLATALLVLSAIASSAIVWQITKPQFVLVWLLSFYILIGIIEGIRAIPAALKRSADRPSDSDSSVPG
jgi:CDP-diacylglycerol--serine O-phosphatidyltransferase